MNSEIILTGIIGKLQQDPCVILLNGDSPGYLSTLLNKIATSLEHSHRVLRLGNNVHKQNCYQALAPQLQIDIAQCTHSELVAKIEKQLSSIEQNKVVLLCEDAAYYDLATFECLRRLSNLNVPNGTEISLVLSGDKQLLKTLNNRQLRSLQQSVSAQFALTETNQAVPTYFNQWHLTLLIPILIGIYLWAAPTFSLNKHTAVSTENKSNNSFPPKEKMRSLKLNEPAFAESSKHANKPANLEHIFQSEQEALAAIRAKNLK